MATIKRTFTFDEATSLRLDRTACRLSKPKSEVVREAIRVYSEHVGLLSEDERARMLATSILAEGQQSLGGREQSRLYRMVRTARPAALKPPTRSSRLRTPEYRKARARVRSRSA